MHLLLSSSEAYMYCTCTAPKATHCRLSLMCIPLVVIDVWERTHCTRLNRTPDTVQSVMVEIALGTQFTTRVL